MRRCRYGRREAAMGYLVRMRFRCDDHRLIGEVEQTVPDAELWRCTVADLVDRMKPAVLTRYPYVADAVDYLDLIELHVRADHDIES
jgi:hypothetical protein